MAKGLEMKQRLILLLAGLTILIPQPGTGQEAPPNRLPGLNAPRGGQAVAAQGRTAAGEPQDVQEDPERPDYVAMNFKDVDLQSLVKLMSELTGKSFIVDPALKGRMTIISPSKISVEAAYRVFLSVLEVHGFAAVESGGVVKVIQAVEAKGKGIETIAERMKGAVEDSMVTQLVPLEHGTAVDFAKFLGPLVPKTGLLVPYPETNTLILIDTKSNVNRILDIVEELDVPGSQEQMQVFNLQIANAESLATKMTQLFQPRKGSRLAQESVKIISDERTNALIVMAPAQTLGDIGEILDMLDRDLVKKRGNIHIYALQHAVAEDVAGVLGELPGKGGEEQEGKVKAPVISKGVEISADKATNTLVIIAEPDEYQILEDVIKELDVPRTMVYVEALIVEVSASKSLDLGVEWRAGEDFDGGYQEDGKGGVYLGGSPGAAAVDALGSGVLPSGFAAGVIGRAITLGDVVFPTFGAFIQAIRSDSDFNILSTPQILTLDNEEATIEVGQNIPFVTRIDQPNEVTERAIQTFEYKDVGVTLKVTPQINDNRFVRLGMEQSVKSVVERTALGGTVLAPTTTFRTAKTVITVKDGETAVIGGLIETRLDRGKTQTPCLGGVPALGWLFKTTTDRDEKTNLLVFLSPHIVESPEEGRRLYEEKRGGIDQEMDKARSPQRVEELRKKAFE